MNRFAQSKKALENNRLNEDENNTVEAENNEVSRRETVKEFLQKQTEEDLSQNAPKSKPKPIEYNTGIPQVKKNLQLPIELELAIKELKAKRNAARPITREKLVTEEVILIEALECYFSQPGINQEVLEYVLNDRMNYLTSVRRGE